jgi:twinkle protein
MPPSKVIEGRLPCPVCPSSDAYHLYDDGHGYCFSCSYFKPSKEVFESVDYTYEHLPFRGLTKQTVEFYDIKTKVSPDGEPVAVGFKYPNGDRQVRSLKDKDFYGERKDGAAGKPGLFGRDRFSGGSNRSVTLSEGAIDAASLYQVLKIPCVGVQSASSAVGDCTVDYLWLQSFERIYLAFDNDAAGREATARVAKLFDFNKVFVVKLDRHKDANEYLQSGEANELLNLWHNAKHYLPETVVSSFYDFRKILTERPKEGVPYPFETLNDKTYGIRTGESVLITAQEGVGKTELMHAIEHQLLKETKDNVGAIFLEEPKARHLQALAGIVLQKPVHLPDCDCSMDSVMGAVEELVEEDDRLHLYSHFGSGDPEVLLDTIRFLVAARSCRYILLDHISMVVSGLSGEDERRGLDYISTRLEMMVKELDFSLILVSHVNDLGQTRGSRYISKVADIRIDAERDLTTGSSIIHLKVSKNRFSGKTGDAGAYTYDSYTRRYSGMTGQTGANDNAENSGSDRRAA